MKATKKVLAMLLAILSLASCFGIMTSAADPARENTKVNIEIPEPQAGKKCKDFAPNVSDTGRLLSLPDLAELQSNILFAEGYISEKAIPTEEDVELVYDSYMKDFTKSITDRYSVSVAEAFVESNFVWAEIDEKGDYTAIDKFTGNTKCVCIMMGVSSWIYDIYDATYKKSELMKELDSRESWPEFVDMMTAQIVDPSTATPEELAYENECLEKYQTRYNNVLNAIDEADKELSEIKAKYAGVDYFINEEENAYHGDDPCLLDKEFDVASNFIQRIFAGLKAFFERLTSIFRRRQMSI